VNTPIDDLVIANGASASNEVSRARMKHTRGLTFIAPDSLTGVVTVMVTAEKEADSGWQPLHSNGEVITLPAGSATVISPIPASRLRLESDDTESATRTFRLWSDQW
jgi:hypothetical protein